MPGRDDIKRILFILTKGGLGDLIVSSPVMEAMHRHFDGSEVTCWANPKHSPILRGHPHVHRCLDMPGDAGFHEKVNILRQGNYDLAVLPWTTSHQTWLVYRAGIPYRIGQAGRLTHSWTFTHPVLPRSQKGDSHTHWVECQLDYARVVGCDASGLRPRIWLFDEEKAEARRLLAERGVSVHDRVCCLHVGRGLPIDLGKWPVEKYVAIGNLLIQELGMKVLLIGTASELPVAAEIESRVPDAVNLVGKTGLRTLAAIIGESDAVICADSGPGHIAAALDVPTISIFALRNGVPDRWRPYGDQHSVVRSYTPLCTVPKCLPEVCECFVCMLAINEFKVIKAVEAVLKADSREERHAA